MHLRKLVLACGFASLALSNYASALGLGEIKLKSALNQPLSAEVQLLDTHDLSAEQIIVALASPADFERNGVDRLYFYTEFQFEVDLNHVGGPVVRITTRDPVREPYLNFLVEARWTAGRLLREYTVLMDLPTFDETVPKAVQSPATSKPKATTKPRAEAPVSTPSTAPQSAAAEEEKPSIIAEQDNSAKKSKVGSDTYGPIGAKDTLWDIAMSVRPDSSVSVHQTMLALQRLNPDAFIRGNINLLKKGQVLRIPDAGEINSVSKSEALAQVNNQISEWSGGAGAASGATSGLGAQLDASKHTSSSRREAEPIAGRVKLEAPSSTSKSGSGQGSGANKGSGRALESELAATLEELDKAKSEKTELSSRVHDLEEQVKTMQRLVDVSNEKLRAMQLNAEKANQDKAAAATTQAPEATASSAAVAINSAAASSAESTAATVAPQSSQAESKAAESKPAEVKKPVRKVVTAPPPEKSLVDLAFDNIAYIGAGVLALALLGGALIMRRRKAQEEELARQTSYEEPPESEPDFSAFAEPGEEPEPEEAPVDEMALFDEEDSTAVAETGDVVGEADIYIAYGKYDQAEEMLLNGLAKDPGSIDIRLKLLEVYSQTHNLAEFDKHYSVILPLATGFALSRAAELRANIPGAGEFASSGATAVEPAVADAAAEEAAILAAQTDSHLPEDEFSFDLDLDDDADLKTSSSNYDMDLSKPSAPDDLSMDDDFSFDFDMPESAVKPEAEDLSDISLALDELDDEGLPADVELGAQEKDDEFNFDFNELETEDSHLVEAAESTKPASLAEEETLGDDFNFDVDVNDVDLAALDHEMESLDALPEAGEAASLDTNFDFDDLDTALEQTDFSLDSDADIAELDSAPAASAELIVEPGTDLDDDFSWEEGAELPVAEDDGELSFEADLDEELSLDEEIALDQESELTGTSTDELVVEDDFSLDEAATAGADDFNFDELDSALGEDDLASETAVESTDFSLADDETDLNFDSASLDDELQALDEMPVASAAEDAADDDLFEQALSDFSGDTYTMDENSDMSDDGLDDDLDFMNDVDEAATKLDLARAYIDMGDNDGARDILAEVASEGNDDQRKEAADLLSRIEA